MFPFAKKLISFPESKSIKLSISIALTSLSSAVMRHGAPVRVHSVPPAFLNHG
jgi:hypothetical protein